MFKPHWMFSSVESYVVRRDSKRAALSVTNCIRGQFGRQTERLNEPVDQRLAAQKVAAADDVPIGDDEPPAVHFEEKGAGSGKNSPILTAYQQLKWALGIGAPDTMLWHELYDLR